MCVYAPEFIITRCGDAKLSRDAAAESGIAPRAGPLPPPEHLSTVELLEKLASIAVVPSVDRNVRVPPAIVNVPGGFATLLPPDNEPPELVKPP